MERAIPTLAQLKDKELFSVLEEGLCHLCSSIENLSSAVKLTNDAANAQAAKSLQVLADEEAAKALLLLDFVRCPKSKSLERGRILKSFYDHVAKGIYVEACWGRPVDFKEVAEHVERERQPYYLDGPNDVDWVFPNDIVMRREGGMYVDYVQESGEEGTYLWIHPEEEWAVVLMPDSIITRLVLALRQSGLLSKSGLEVIAKVWRPADVQPSMTWDENEALIIETLEAAQDKGLTSELDEADGLFIVRHWPFPLYPLDLRRIEGRGKEETRRRLRGIQKSWGPGC